MGAAPADPLGFVRYPNAVGWPAVGDWVPQGRGLTLLLPVGGCARGIGGYQNGYREVNANWVGDGSCTRLRLDPAPTGGPGGIPDGPPGSSGGWRGGGIAADAAVVGPDGAILAATGSGLRRHRPDGTSEELARADLSPDGRSTVRGLVTFDRGNRVLIGTSTVVAGQRGPVVLSSDDGGRTLTRRVLPVPSGFAERGLIFRLAAHGNEVVAFGWGTGETPAQRRIPVWRSGDAGRTWSASLVRDLPAHLMINGLAHTGTRWVAVGAADNTHADRQDTTHVLTSTDGLSWTPAAAAVPGVGAADSVTVDRAGGLVITGVVDDAEPTAPGERTTYCGVVWTGDGVGPWQRGELGCGDAPPRATATLADGRVLIAGNRDLWLRPATR
ncbi:hypothetical protein GCM10010123_01340 [Pilimelia anulata]|uniref:Uncharacterized protein n=1 Tax=Pilimelia anulata TaxID=53371 RepID=A0A8J3AYQ7_9ACTN|nr:hypothetical protein GCM10010123_01340 [Pilimelia anulata]